MALGLRRLLPLLGLAALYLRPSRYDATPFVFREDPSSISLLPVARVSEQRPGDAAG
jgi:hypothetical protein